MTNESRDYLEMAFRSIECFAKDGTLRLHELDELVTIALRDGVMDDNEKRVLRNIFSRLTPSELGQDMLERIAQIRAQYNF